MIRVSYKGDTKLERAHLSNELNAVLHNMGCITVGDALNMPLIKLIQNKDMISTWDEYVDFVIRVHTARGRIAK